MAPGARSKFGVPMFEPEVFRKQMYCIEERTCDTVGTFWRPSQSFGARGIVPRCPPLVTPLIRRLMQKWKFLGIFQRTSKALSDDRGKIFQV